MSANDTKMDSLMNSREGHILAKKPSIRSGGFTLGGTYKDQLNSKSKDQKPDDYVEDFNSQLSIRMSSNKISDSSNLRKSSNSEFDENNQSQYEGYMTRQTDMSN